MLFENLNLSNTFSQWVTTTQKTVSFLDAVEKQGVSNVIYSNTNISVSGNVIVGGNTNITGLFILDEVDIDDLVVAGNLNVNKTLSAENVEFLNLNVVSNVATINTTLDLKVGQDSYLYRDLNSDTFYTSNLDVSGNFYIDNTNVTLSNIVIVDGSFDNVIFTNNLSSNVLNSLTANFDAITTNNLIVTQNVDSVNVTNELRVGTDATVYGNLDVTANVTLDSLTENYGNFETANVFSFIGNANTQIYNTIQATTAATTVSSNISEFISYAIGLG